MANAERQSERSTDVVQHLLKGAGESQDRMYQSLAGLSLATPLAVRSPRRLSKVLAVALGISVIVNHRDARERQKAAAHVLSRPTQEETISLEQRDTEEGSDREFRLESSKEFIVDLFASIEQADERVWLEFMQFESGEIISVLVDALIDAKRRGVDVALHLDPYSQSFTRVGNRDVWKYSQIVRNPVEPRSGLDERTLKQRNRYMTDYDLRKLEEAGIVTYLQGRGRLKRLPLFGGGNHRKFAIVDNLAWLGSMNLTDSDILGMDNFMLRITADELVDIISNVSKQPPTVDTSYLSSHAQETGEIDWELLVDAGRPHSSISYQRALEMVSRAESRVEFVTQYWPAGIFKETLIRRARSGLNVTVYMQSLGDHRIWRYPFRTGFQNFFTHEWESSGLQLVFPPRPTHAKGLVVDGQAALFGSNNLFEPTLRVGVRELSLYTEDPNLVGEIEKRIFNHS